MAWSLTLEGTQIVGLKAVKSAIKMCPALLKLAFRPQYVSDPTNGYTGALLDAPTGVYDLDVGKDFVDLVVVHQHPRMLITLDGDLVHDQLMFGVNVIDSSVLQQFRVLNLDRLKRVVMYRDQGGKTQFTIQPTSRPMDEFWQGNTNWPLVGEVNLETGVVTK